MVRGHDRRNGARVYLRNFLSFVNSKSVSSRNISIVTHIFINGSNLEYLKSQRQSYSTIIGSYLFSVLHAISSISSQQKMKPMMKG